MADKIYPKGLNIFPPREGAPAFVKAQISIEPKAFVAFLQENKQYLNEKGYFRFNLLSGDKGLYMTLDTWKPKE